MDMTLTEIFERRDHEYDKIHNLVKRKIRNNIKAGSLVDRVKGAMFEIDLGGRTFILDRPLQLHRINLITICNGTLIAGPDFPEDEFLVDIQHSHGLQVRNLFLECSKRANGVSAQHFFRIRVEDCYIVHQKSYGIYSPTTGGNHELEIFKCHISEFLFGDGYPKKTVNYGVIPEYDIDENRVSTGVFLGQADNVVADCNINLCKVGIFSGMRANRIQGNHITGGGSKKLKIFKGIELNNFHKSSALIVNNYIDNCCLWINCDSMAYNNTRNYFHLTDNLFYRGYNHPIDGEEEFHHIVINPLEKDSLIANLHICDNHFYNQPENLEGIKPRVISPIHITSNRTEDGSVASIDHDKLAGVSIKSNYFTNAFPTFVVPVGTEIIKEITVNPEKNIYRVSFDNEMPLGNIRRADVTVVSYTGDIVPVAVIKNINKRTVTLSIACAEKAKVQVEVSSEGRYAGRYNYFVK